MTTNPINNIREHLLASLTNQMTQLVGLPLPLLMKVLSCLPTQDAANLGQACQFTARVLSPNPHESTLTDFQTRHHDYLVQLFDIVKSNADHLNPYAFQMFRMWGMTDQAMLLECAKCAAAKDPYFVSRSIKEFGITDQNYLFELAKILAQNYHGLSEHIQNFGITDPEMLFEIAKIAAAKDGVNLWKNIKNYEITDEDKLFEILKIVVAECSYATEHLKNLGITDPHRRFELFKIAARNKFSSKHIVEHMENYDITETWMLVEIAKILASKLEPFSTNKIDDLLDFIKKAGITEQNDLFEIAKVAVSHDPRQTSENLQSFKIADESMRYELAKIAADKNPEMFGRCIANYEITDQNKLFELAKIVAVKDPVALSQFIAKYKIKDPKRRFQLAKLATKQENWRFYQIYEYIKNYEITEQEWLCEIFQISVARDGYYDFLKARKFIQFNSHLQTLALIAFSRVANEAQRQEHVELPNEISSAITSKSARNFLSSFTNLAGLNIPVHFKSDEEKQEVVQALQNSFKEWKTFAKEFGIPDNILNSLEKAIFKGRHSLLTQKKDLLWLFTLPIVTTESPLRDETMAPLLLSIAKITDPSKRVAATNAFIALTSSPEGKEKLKALITGTKEHLHLVVLFAAASALPEQAIRELVVKLSPSIYKDSKIIGSIIEVMLALAKSSDLSIEKKQELLDMISGPLQGPREPRPTYTARLEKFRPHQQHWITMIHSMLHFEQSLLSDVKDTAELVKAWEALMCKTFGVQPDQLPLFLNTFVHSKRYPNGLIIYGSRLQTLPDSEKELLMPPLKKFVISVLHGTFPEIRYDFAENPHLETIFSHDKDLLEKWKTPLTITIKQKENQETKKETPQELTQRLLKQALGDNHLGEDQKSKYPELDALLSGSLSPIETRSDNEQEQKRVEIINRCAELLNPESDPSTITTALSALIQLVPSDVQFHQDVKDILTQLSAPQMTTKGWTIDDTDAWEDFKLMGTEVPNSCQKIHGDPNLNKCLLASILDGKIRLMVARNDEGKIIGRVVLRVLWDKVQKKPVLFAERLYAQDQNLEQDILEGCRQKAESMGLTLVLSSRDYAHLSSEHYPETLASLGGPAPYEYVDALAGIEKKGIYSVPDSLVFWKPPVKMQTATPIGDRTLEQTQTSELECF